jgi:hypothetical protein
LNALNRAVFAAYGWPEGIDDEEKILKSLLALILERSARGKGRGPSARA